MIWLTRLLLFGASLLFLLSPSSALAADATLLSRLPGITTEVVEAVGDHVYVGGASDGLHVFDVSGPVPVFAGSIAMAPGVTTPQVKDLDHRGGVLYVAVRNHGVEAYDLTDPVAPNRIATVTDADSVERIQVVGDRLHVLDRHKDLLLYDVASGAPSLLGSEDLLSDHEAYDFIVDGDDVYISRVRFYAISDVIVSDDSVLQMDVTDPANPLPVAIPFSGAQYYYDPYVEGGVYHVRTASGETSLFGLPAGTLQGTWPEDGRSYFPDGNGLIVDSQKGLFYLQGTNAVASLALAGDCVRSDREGDLLYRGTGRFGIQVVDVADPLQMSLEGVWRNGGDTLDLVTAVPGVDYVTGTGGFRAIDVSSPSNPVVVWSFDEYSRGIAIDDAEQYLFVHFPQSRYLRAFDVTNPLAPQLVQEVFPVNTDAKLAWRDGVLYAARYNGFDIFDVSDPTTGIPQLASLALNGRPALALKGDYAYVGGTSNGNVVDISDPANPSLVGTFPFSTFVQTTDMTVLGDQLFVVGITLDGVDVLSLADPENPVAAGVTLPGATERGYSVRTHGHYLALAEQEGIFVYDMSDPLNPSLELTALDSAPYQTYGVEFRGTQLHSVGEDTQILATTLDPVVGVPDLASLLRLHLVAPNPFNPRTAISFTAPAGERVEVEILDLRGRRVDLAHAGIGTGSPQQISWAPQDLASGVYLVRVASGHASATRKVTLVK